MTMSVILWCLIGVLSGMVHAWMLWRAAQSPFSASGLYFARLLLVGMVLFVSAVLGGLLPAVAGWTIAYFISVGLMQKELAP